MSTIHQLTKLKHRRVHKFHKKKSNALKGCPQRKGICIKVLKEKPKKPNSAKRSVVKVRLTTGKRVRAQVPGEKHALVVHHRVLIRGGRTRDLPGVKYRVVRGKLDSSSVDARRQKISKYGVQARSIIEDLLKQINQL
jgi:small subunit ribosomal protein S12